MRNTKHELSTINMFYSPQKIVILPRFSLFKFSAFRFSSGFIAMLQNKMHVLTSV